MIMTARNKPIHNPSVLPCRSLQEKLSKYIAPGYADYKPAYVIFSCYLTEILHADLLTILTKILGGEKLAKWIHVGKK